MCSPDRCHTESHTGNSRRKMRCTCGLEFRKKELMRLGASFFCFSICFPRNIDSESSPVSSTRAAKQAKAERSRFRLWRWVEKSRMESSHSPNPRRHWNLCSTKPLQNTSLSSDSIDLRQREKEVAVRVLIQLNAAFFLHLL